MNKKVLFVCIGNTCRSPMAEAIYQHFINSNVHSCGIKINAKYINEHTIEVINNKLNIDLTNKQTTDIKNLNLSEFNLIYALDTEVSDYLRNSKIKKVFNMFVDDPYGKNIANYYKVYDDLLNKIRKTSIF